MENCPFWSMLSMKCRVSKGGLFIPLDDHIEAYCKTPYFSQCLQHALHSENRLRMIERANQARNRRKFSRVDACYKITLVRLIHSGAVATHHSAYAETLDLSSGGMRLTTNIPLKNDSVLQFSFGNDFPEGLHEGIGQVAWCNKEIDNPGYQAGVSFQDEQTIEAMDLFLGMHFQDS